MPILGFDINRKLKGTVKAYEFEVIKYFYPTFFLNADYPRL